jgi:chemotaxis protein CheD
MDEGQALIRKHFLHPCMIFAHPREHWVATLLGSCVAVCLWDPTLGLGGMNHYMLPLWNGEGLPTPRYGNIAIEKLIQKMVALGADPRRLLGRIYGGAMVLGTDMGRFRVGGRNITVAQELLATHRIPILETEVGGEQGRRVQFNTCTGEVTVQRMKQQGRAT